MAAESKQAFVARLVLSPSDQLRRFLVSRVRNACDESDLVQEIFLRLLRVPYHDAIRSPEAYLFTVAKHVAQQHAMRQSSRPSSIELQDVCTELATAHSDPALEIGAQQSSEDDNRYKTVASVILAVQFGELSDPRAYGLVFNASF